ncbi:hypothetical protein GCM10028784_01520 [Myceligenerans cantabricum]
MVAGLLTVLLLAALVGMMLAGRAGAGAAQPGAAGAAGQDAHRARPAGAGNAGQDAASAEAQAEAERAAALDQSFVTAADTGTRSVTVDSSEDPEAVYAWMDETSETLDGWTIEVEGLKTPGREERRAVDAAASEAEGDRPVRAQACPDLPTGPRTRGGSTVPYLGCDPVTGEEPGAQPVRGGPARSLAAAVDATLTELVPGTGLGASRAKVTRGQAVVDLPAGFPEAAEAASVPAYEIDRALIFTAYSNGALDSVRFRVAGDCRSYATAVDGDMCATVSLPVQLGDEE